MTDVRVSQSSSPYDSQVIASVDGVTVLGSGTQADPLRLAGGAASSQFSGQFVSTYSELPAARCMPVYVSTAPLSEPGASATVSVASAGPENPPVSKALPFVVGLIVDPGDGTLVTVQTTGVVTAAESDWDGVTGESGGLDPGAAYYLSTGVFGQISVGIPSASGTESSLVGVAQSATQLRLATPAFPINNP